MSAEQLTKSNVIPAIPRPSLFTKPHGSRRSSIALVHGSAAPRSPVVFMFPGGGAQYPGMGRELYRVEPIFRAQLDCCAALASKHLSVDLLEALLVERPAKAMERPSVALPALFATEYALAHLWMSLGVQPVAMVGHSLGEYVAACLSGVFSLQDAMRLVGLRGVLLESVGSGAMLSVPLPAKAIANFFGNRLSLAAINAPDLCVVSGRCSDIDRFQEELNAMHVDTQRIPIAAPAHSCLLDPVCDEFRQEVLRVTLQKPGIRFISNVTGSWISDLEATSPTYWVCQFRNTVQFAAGLKTLMNDDPQILLEVGPGRVLSSLARLNAYGEGRLILPSMRRRNETTEDIDVVHSSLSRVFQHDVELSSRRG